MDDVKLAAIVSSFNRLELLKECLPSLVSAFNGLPVNAAIIVFDAGSTDGSQEWLQEYIGAEPSCEIKLLSADGDSSFSAGVNQSALFAISRYEELEFLLLFETDNLLKNNTPIKDALSFLNEVQDSCAVGFTVAKLDGSPAGYGCPFPSAAEFAIGPNLTHILKLDAPHPHWHNANGNAWTYCDVIFTSPILIRKAAWEQAGGFDSAQFPFSDCDTDWCIRARAQGWKLVVIRTSAVIHDNRQQLSAWSAQRAQNFHRARLALLRKHKLTHPPALKPLLFLRHLLECAVLAPTVLLGGRQKRLLESRWKLLTTTFNDYD